MFAGSKRRRLHNKTVPVIFRSPGLMDIWSELICGGVSNKVVIDEELQFYAFRGLRFINHPAGNSLAVGTIKHSAQISIGSCEVKAHGERRDEQGLGHGL
jgi:hypothetical protein